MMTWAHYKTLLHVMLIPSKHAYMEPILWVKYWQVHLGTPILQHFKEKRFGSINNYTSHEGHIWVPFGQPDKHISIPEQVQEINMLSFYIGLNFYNLNIKMCF